MIGRMDLDLRKCSNCEGSGRDPLKRTRKCPECEGSGAESYCTICGGKYGVECKDEVMDQTECSVLMHAREDEVDFSDVTDEEFDSILEELVDDMSAAELLAIGEVNSVLREELNNQVLSTWAMRQRKTRGTR